MARVRSEPGDAARAPRSRVAPPQRSLAPLEGLPHRGARAVFWGVGRREGMRRGAGSRPPRGAPLSGRSAASPPRRPRGTRSPGLAAREAPSRRRWGGARAPLTCLRVHTSNSDSPGVPGVTGEGDPTVLLSPDRLTMDNYCETHHSNPDAAEQAEGSHDVEHVALQSLAVVVAL